MITKITAIKSLDPSITNIMSVGDIMDWGDNTPISDTLIQEEVTRLQAEYDAAQYARDRATAYPSLADQADMQFHDLANSTTTWLDAIQAVKDAYPKP